jgi:hypothetical protein
MAAGQRNALWQCELPIPSVLSVSNDSLALCRVVEAIWKQFSRANHVMSGFRKVIYNSDPKRLTRLVVRIVRDGQDGLFLKQHIYRPENRFCTRTHID